MYAREADAHVFHDRGKEGLEVDAIVEAVDGHWAVFEIRPDGQRMTEGANNLNRLAGHMEGSDHEVPSELAVIVPNGYGREGMRDVGVIPVGPWGL